jgi:serine/threonine protein kinase/tetratricopeptide (TPR) repeat protein
MSTTDDNTPTSGGGPIRDPGRGGPDTAPTSGQPLGTSEIRGVLDLPLGDQGLNLPKRIGPYQVLKRLGRGGMGEVLLGQRSDDQFHKRVAIKLIRRGVDDATDGREVLKRFELERQVLAALNHPNIARLLDAGQLPDPDGRPYFVMEYVEGESIDEYCDRMQLNTEQRLGLFIKVCAAVHHAHQNLVVHRDIKPSNILVDSTGEPKLMDFGIAKLLNPAMSGVTFATQFDHGPMTPEYASPEQVAGKPVTTSSDVYALGVLLYELLTGRRPYQLKSRAMDAMVSAILNEEPEKPSTAVTHEFEQPTMDGGTRTLDAKSLAKPREGEVTRLKRKLAGDVDNIVLMAMRKSPQRRYASAEAMGEDIKRHLAGKTVKAMPETWVYVAGKFVRRNKAGVLAAGLIASTIAGTAVVATVAWKREQAARERADRLAEASRSVVARAVDAMGQLASPVASEDAARLRLEASDAFVKAVEDIQETDSGLDLRPERAAALGLAGKIRTDIRGGSSGDAAEGLTQLERSVKLRRELLAEGVRGAGGGADASAKRELAIALVHLGDAQSRGAGGAQAAAATYDEALELARGVVDAGGAEGDALRRLLATTLVARADALVQAGKGEQARPLVEESLRLRRVLADARPSSTLRQRDLSVGLGRAADMALSAGDAPGAERLLRQALEVRESILRAEPSPRAERDAAVMAGKLARTLRAKSPPDLEQARVLLDRQETLVRRLAEADPSNRRGQVDVARALIELAEWHAAQTAHAAAEAAAAEAGSVLGRLTGKDRTAEVRFLQAQSDELRGTALRGQGRGGDDALRAALEAYRELAATDPSTPAFAAAAERVGALLGE